MKKECLATILAVDKWRSYLQHQKFTIKTDHRSLLYLTDQRAHTKLQQKGLMKLMDLQFSIQYKAGTTNMVVDALSRCTPGKTICALSTCTPSWLLNLVDGYNEDP
jgi:flagellar motor switch/type III secretory pathway protein FliN